mmetsp:Transcript_28334/g.46559  ORF Transcript_28334/g.46559 Transcript_28334/m.46559 type:complete len:616 (-) Transcript_28334:28-1875(-)
MADIEGDNCQTGMNAPENSSSTKSPISLPQDRARCTRLSPPTSPPSPFCITPDFRDSSHSRTSPSPVGHSRGRRRQPPPLPPPHSCSRSRSRSRKRRSPPPSPPSSPSTEPVFIKETRMVDAPINPTTPIAPVDLTLDSESEDDDVVEISATVVRQPKREYLEEKKVEEQQLPSKQTQERLFAEWSELLKGLVNEAEMAVIVRKNIERGLISSPTEMTINLFAAIKSGRSWMTEDLPQNGKTTTAMLCVLSLITLTSNGNTDTSIEAMVIHPNREGVINARNNLERLLQGTGFVFEHAFYVGQNNESRMVTNIRSLENGVRVVFCCPGRMSHLIGAGLVNLDNIKTVVMEEWDILSNESFKKEMDVIVGAVKRKKCLLLCFTSTTPEQNGVKENQEWMRRINECGPSGGDQRAGKEWEFQSVVPANVKVQDDADRMSNLKEILQQHTKERVLIFANTNERVEHVYRALCDWKEGDALSLQLPKIDVFGAKIESIDPFERQTRWHAIEQLSEVFLCCTQVVARNIQRFNVVINFETPVTLLEYKQRFGRLRGSKRRKLYSLCDERDEEMMRHIRELHRNYGQTPDGVRVKQESDVEISGAQQSDMRSDTNTFSEYL